MIKGQLKNRYVWKLTEDQWHELGKKALHKGIYVRYDKEECGDTITINEFVHKEVDSISKDYLSYTSWCGGFSGGCPGDNDEYHTDYYDKDEYGYTWALTVEELKEYEKRNETYQKKHCAYVKLHQYFFNSNRSDAHFANKYIYYMEGNPQVGDIVSGDRYVGVVTEVYKDDPGAFENYCVTERDLYDNVYKRLVESIGVSYNDPKSIFERYNKRIAKAKEILNELGVKKEC